MVKRVAIAVILFTLCLAQPLLADTVTQGTFGKLKAIGEKVSTELDEYATERDAKLKNLEQIKEKMQTIKNAYSKAHSRKQRLGLQTRILASSTDLVEGYLDLYGLAITKMEEIIPNLQWMRDAAAHGVSLGPAAKHIQDPVTRKQLGNLYGNLATLTLLLDDKGLQGEVAPLLKANEQLFQGFSHSHGIFKNITGNLDKVIKYYSNLYAKTNLAYRKLQQKKQKLLLANNLMAFVIAIEPVKQKIIDLSAQGGMEVPEMDVDLDEIANLTQVYHQKDRKQEKNAILPFQYLQHIDIIGMRFWKAKCSAP